MRGDFDFLESAPLTATPVAAATAAATTTTAAIATATTAATTRALFARAGFIDGQSASLEILSMEHGYGLFRVFFIGHLNKPETTRFAGGPVLHYVH